MSFLCLYLNANVSQNRGPDNRFSRLVNATIILIFGLFLGEFSFLSSTIAVSPTDPVSFVAFLAGLVAGSSMGWALLRHMRL
jgi:hypothetical protein